MHPRFDCDQHSAAIQDRPGAPNETGALEQVQLSANGRPAEAELDGKTRWSSGPDGELCDDPPTGRIGEQGDAHAVAARHFGIRRFIAHGLILTPSDWLAITIQAGATPGWFRLWRTI